MAMHLADGTSEELVAEFRALTERQLVIIRTLSMRLKGLPGAEPYSGAGNAVTGADGPGTGSEEVEPNE